MLHAEFPHAALSVDTFRPRVAREALRAGASIVNDVTGCRRLEMRKLIYTQEAGVMVMHSRRADAGDAQMYGEDDVGIETELRDRVRDVLNMGVPKWDVIADCGIGFGKNVSQCLRLIGKLQGGVLAKGMDDVPMALGISRKSFLNRVASSTDEKDWATAGVLGNVISRGGVDVVRVHNENMAFVVRAAEMLKGKYV